MLMRYLTNSSEFNVVPRPEFCMDDGRTGALLNQLSSVCAYALPSISRTDPSFYNPFSKRGDYWRGRIWGPHVMLVYWGLAEYSHVTKVLGVASRFASSVKLVKAKRGESDMKEKASFRISAHPLVNQSGSTGSKSLAGYPNYASDESNSSEGNTNVNSKHYVPGLIVAANNTEHLSTTARVSLVDQSKELFLREWRQHRHVHENYDILSGEGCDVLNSSPFYSWGALTGFISLLEQFGSTTNESASAPIEASMSSVRVMQGSGWPCRY